MLLLSAYAWYVLGHLRAEATRDSELSPLRFHKLDRGAPSHPEHPRLRIVTFQVLFALACIVGGAWGFVHAIQDLSSVLGLDGRLLALVVAPIATELPEKLNSVIWIRQGKDYLRRPYGRLEAPVSRSPQPGSPLHPRPRSCCRW